MADQKITIEIDGKDNASTTFKKVGMSVTDLNSAMTIASRVYDVAAQAFKMTVNEAQAYDQQIRDVMLSTGATAEESSRLVQVVDDAGVSYGTLKTAMKMASKEGIEPNIASLQSLSDQYLKLAPGVERNQFLLDKFGKSGLEMARVMELGGTALGEMNDEIKGGLVLTQDAIDQSEEYRKNVDELTDALQSFKVTMGNAVIPIINDSIEANKSWNDSMEEAAELTGTTDKRTNMYVARLIEQRKASIDAADAVAAHGDALDGVLIPALEDAGESVAAFTMSYEDQIALIADVSKEYENQSDKLGDLTSEHEDLLAEKQKLIDEGWWAESEKIKDVNEKIDENRDKYSEATAEFELDSRRRILAMLEEQLSLDGLSQQEQEILLAKGLAWGVYSEQAVAASRAAMEEVAALTAAINTIPSERTFTMSVLVQGADAVGGLGAGYGASQWDTRTQHASGGSFIIPSSYGNEGFRMGGGDTASGGEKLKITPAGKSGNEDIIAAIYATRTDESKLARAIVEETLKGRR